MSFLLRMLYTREFMDLRRMCKEFSKGEQISGEVIRKKFYEINHQSNNVETFHQRKVYPLKIINSTNIGNKNYHK